MNYQFLYNIEVLFNLTKEEFDLITLAIKNGESKLEATPGHFWFGNINTFNWAQECEDDLLPIRATFRQIDIVIMKSLEKYVYYIDEHRELATQLFNKLMKLLNKINEKSTELYSEEILEL